MFSTSFQIIINIAISIFIIYAAHFFFQFLKDNLTSKKTKDLVSIQAEKYKKIVEDIQKARSNTNPFETPAEKQAMEEDLTLFLQDMVQTPPVSNQ